MNDLTIEEKLPQALVGVPIEKLIVVLANGDRIVLTCPETLQTPSGQVIGCSYEEGEEWRRKHPKSQTQINAESLLEEYCDE